MVQICRASRKTTDDPIQQGIDRFYVYQDIAHYATKGITVDEFPAPDGSVELVAEVVTMTKQDYDELMAFSYGLDLLSHNLFHRNKKIRKMKNKTELSDYARSLHQAAIMPRFFIGQEVKTEHGNGIIVSIEMPHNGLYLQPERAEAVVWYGTERAFEEGTGWVNFTYKLSGLSAVENDVEDV